MEKSSLTTSPTAWPPLDTIRFKVVTAAARPDLWTYMMSADAPKPLTKCWPRWMRSQTGSRFGSKLGYLKWMAEYQFLILDMTEAAPERADLEKVVACAQAIPFYWRGLDSERLGGEVFETALRELPDTGPVGVLRIGTLQAWRKSKAKDDSEREWMCVDGRMRFNELEFEVGEQETEAERESCEPNALSALQIAVDAEYREFGFADLLIERFRVAAKESNLSVLVVPVRPTRKHEYPRISMEEYVTWAQDGGKQSGSSGLPFDSWLRKHVRHGARIIRVCPDAHVQEGDVDYWKRLAGIDICFDGLEPVELDSDLGPVFEVLLPGGLVPMRCYPRVNKCVYREPNIWVYHALK